MQEHGNKDLELSEKYKIKKYFYDHLLDDIAYIRWRTQKIEKLTNRLVTFNFLETHLERKTKLVNRRNTNARSSNITQWINAANLMDAAHSEGIIHGDLNFKNIAHFDNKIIILDWEPCLKQVINGKPTLMVTLPKTCKHDIENEKVSKNTDLLCFAKLIRQIKGSEFPTRNLVKYSSNKFYTMLYC